MRVGILGGGQLGCMLAESLLKLGSQVSFLDSNPNVPAAFRYSDFVCAPWSDEVQLKSFFNKNDLVIYECEHLPVAFLSNTVKLTGTPLYPSEQALYVTQNRIREKNFLRTHGFPVCNFEACSSVTDLIEKSEKWTFPFIVKTSEGGYDGKGQWFISDSSALQQCVVSLKNFEHTLIIEEVVDIFQEASVIVGRNHQGESVCFPVFENIHKNHILDFTLVPAHISVSLQNELKKYATEAADQLNIVGLLTTEFFIAKRKSNRDSSDSEFQIYINEFAPRPHNSGHITRNCCQLSQFDLLAQILLGLPLTEPISYTGSFCMGNILGEHFSQVVDVVFYGKNEAQPKRKMGHFVTKAKTRQDALDAARSFRRT